MAHNVSQKLPNLPLWEPAFSKAKLDEMQADPMFDFEQSMRLQVIRPGELEFPSFKTCYQEGVDVAAACRRGMPVAIGVDLSSATRPGNFITAVGVDIVARRRHLLEVRNGAWKSPETVRQLGEVCANHPGLQYIMVENNAYQGALIDWVNETKADFPWWMKIEPFTTGANKADPILGVRGFEVEFKNKAWVLPASMWEGHKSSCVCAWCVWSREFSLYPKSPTTDGIMATWFAKTAIDRWMWMQPGNFSVGAHNMR